MIYSDDYWNDVDKVIKCIPGIEDLNGKSILITGGTGMICSSVCEILLRRNKTENAGIKIYLAGRSKERTEKRFYEFNEGADYFFVEFDAVNPVKLDLDVDFIIHGASNANPSVYAKEPVETALSNILGTNNLLKMAAEKNVKRLLYVSSSEVYGNVEKARPFVEDDYGFVDILNPRACYPNSKRMAETLCSCYGAEYGVDTVSVRPGHIYGPTITNSDTRASAEFTRNVLNGEPIVMKSAGDQLRSYCYTLDCASALLAVLINGKKGEAYNISNKDSVVTIRQIAEALANYGGTEIVFENPSDLEKRGYNMMNNSALVSEKLEGLGWKACFSLEDGVKRTIDTLKRG